MRKKSEFTAAERERIAREYLTGNETARELSLKYGVKGKSTISNWAARLQNPKKTFDKLPSRCYTIYAFCGCGGIGRRA